MTLLCRPPGKRFQLHIFIFALIKYFESCCRTLFVLYMLFFTASQEVTLSVVLSDANLISHTSPINVTLTCLIENSAFLLPHFCNSDHI